MIGMRRKVYWLVMVVDECWFAGELRVCKCLGIELGGVVSIGNFVRVKKLRGVFVVMGRNLKKIRFALGVVVVRYLVSFEEVHI